MGPLKAIRKILLDKSEEAKKTVEKILSHNANVESRPVVFREEYRRQYSELRSKIYGFGRKATYGGWVGGTRKQARKLARKMARHEIRMAKAEQ